MERIGFGTGYDSAGTTAREMATWMKSADQRGFDLGFFSESALVMRDAPSSLAAFSIATERLRLGATMTVRLRSPVVMAQTLASLDELSGGRIVLATGACMAPHAAKHSLEPANPPKALRESIEAIRLILSGERISYEGEFVKLDNVGLGWKPLRTHVPIYLAATSPTGLKQAGQFGDGVLLNAMCSPAYSRNAVAIIRQAAEASGRDLNGFEVAQLVVCSLEDTAEQAYDAARFEVAKRFDPLHRAYFHRFRMAVGDSVVRDSDLPLFEQAYESGGHAELMRVLPDSYIHGMTASGTADEVLQRVEDFRAAGVTLPIIRPAASHQTQRILDLFAQ
jgi:5,10-methylenetetrahydromethanopterin reductase